MRAPASRPPARRWRVAAAGHGGGRDPPRRPRRPPRHPAGRPRPALPAAVERIPPRQGRGRDRFPGQPLRFRGSASLGVSLRGGRALVSDATLLRAPASSVQVRVRVASPPLEWTAAVEVSSAQRSSSTKRPRLASAPASWGTTPASSSRSAQEGGGGGEGGGGPERHRRAGERGVGPRGGLGTRPRACWYASWEDPWPWRRARAAPSRRPPTWRPGGGSCIVVVAAAGPRPPPPPAPWRWERPPRAGRPRVLRGPPLAPKVRLGSCARARLPPSGSSVGLPAGGDRRGAPRSAGVGRGAVRHPPGRVRPGRGGGSACLLAAAIVETSRPRTQRGASPTHRPGGGVLGGNAGLALGRGGAVPRAGWGVRVPAAFASLTLASRCVAALSVALDYFVLSANRVPPRARLASRASGALLCSACAAARSCRHPATRRTQGKPRRPLSTRTTSSSPPEGTRRAGR